MSGFEMSLCEELVVADRVDQHQQVGREVGDQEAGGAETGERDEDFGADR